MSARATRSAADRQNLPAGAPRRQILACFHRRLARKIVVFHRFVPRPRFCIDGTGRVQVQRCVCRSISCRFPSTDRTPASKEDEIGNLLLEMDKEEEREHGDLAAAGGERSRFSWHSSALPANNSSSVGTDSAQQELPDPATAAARLLSKFERPFGLPVGKRK